MEFLELYWDNYWGLIVAIGCIPLALYSWHEDEKHQKKVETKSYSKKSKIIFITLIVIQSCHILYFKYQEYTPVNLSLRGKGKVSIEEIVSIEKKYLRSRHLYLIRLSSGSEIVWNESDVFMTNRNNDRLSTSEFPILNVLDYK